MHLPDQASAFFVGLKAPRPNFLQGLPNLKPYSGYPAARFFLFGSVWTLPSLCQWAYLAHTFPHFFLAKKEMGKETAIQWGYPLNWQQVRKANL